VILFLGTFPLSWSKGHADFVVWTPLPNADRTSFSDSDAEVAAETGAMGSPSAAAAVAAVAAVAAKIIRRRSALHSRLLSAVMTKVAGDEDADEVCRKPARMRTEIRGDK
jgi:hypothetical protein